MAQTSIQANPDAGQAGSLASALGYRTVSKVAAEAITPGRFVVLTADDEHTCELPDATGEVNSGRALGVALLDPTRETAAYAAGDVVTILVEGEIWVVPDAAVTAGARANVSYAGAGLFHATGGAGDDIATGAVYTSTTASAVLAKVRLEGVFS